MAVSVDALEQRVREDCEGLAYRPSYYSEWFSHVAQTLAMMHEWRCPNKPVDQWLLELAEARGGATLYDLIEHERQRQ